MLEAQGKLDAHGQRLMGASLLILANKMDLANCMNADEIRKVFEIRVRVIESV